MTKQVKKGNLLLATNVTLGVEVPAFWFAQLGEDEYLIILDSIFLKDPIRRRFVIVTAKKFKQICKGKTLQS